MSRNVQLKILRGILANKPTLGDGEFYFATDQLQLYVGLNGDSLPIGGTMSVQIADKTNTGQLLAVNSDGSLLMNTAVTKTAILKTGSLTTTSITAGQTILTYTVTAGKVFYLDYLDIQSRLTAISATASILGTVTLSVGGVAAYTSSFVNPTTSDAGSQAVRISFSEPIPINAGTVIALTVTPNAVTSMLWIGNFGGFER